MQSQGILPRTGFRGSSGRFRAALAAQLRQFGRYGNHSRPIGFFSPYRRFQRLLETQIRPSLPPRISRRCHSLLALASTLGTATATEDADYENLNMPSQPGQTEHFAQQEPQFAPFGRLYQQSLRLESKRIRASREEEDNNVEQSRRASSSRRQQLMYRLELMLNDASINNCSQLY